MSNYLKLILIFIILLIHSILFSQSLDLAGKWQSSTGKEFTLNETMFGFTYIDHSTGNSYKAVKISENQFRADIQDFQLTYSIFFNLQENNIITGYSNGHNQNFTWQKIELIQVGVLTNEFNFDYAEQHNSQWCWAACIQMILNYYNVDITQYDIVYRTYGMNPIGELPNWPGSILAVHQNLNNWNIDNDGNFYTVMATQHNGAPVQVYLINELKEKRPVLIGYNSHAVLITACSYIMFFGQPVIQSITVRDPWRGNGEPGTGKITYHGIQLASQIQAHWYIRVAK